MHIKPFRTADTNIYAPPYEAVVFSFVAKHGDVHVEQHTSMPCLEYLYNFANTLWQTKYDARQAHSNWWNPKDSGFADKDKERFRILADYSDQRRSATAFLQNIVNVLHPEEQRLGIAPTIACAVNLPDRVAILLEADHLLHNNLLSFSLWMNLVRFLMGKPCDADWVKAFRQSGNMKSLPLEASAILAAWPRLLNVKPDPWTGHASISSGSGGVGTYLHPIYLRPNSQLPSHWRESPIGKFVKKEFYE